MNRKKLQFLSILLAALMLPFSWASAAVSLEFNNSINNQVGSGSIGTLLGAPGGTIVLSLQLFSTLEGTTALDYWLSQFSGPSAGAFSIIARDYTGSIFPDPSASNVQVTSTTDDRSNSAPTGVGTPDGVADNLINPRNGFDLGSSKADTTVNQPAGTWQVATFTLQISPTAALGTYQIRSFDYSGFGWSQVLTADNPFSAQAAMNINVVPEPATWSLIALGGLGAFGLNLLRARRTS